MPQEDKILLLVCLTVLGSFQEKPFIKFTVPLETETSRRGQVHRPIKRQRSHRGQLDLFGLEVREPEVRSAYLVVLFLDHITVRSSVSLERAISSGRLKVDKGA